MKYLISAVFGALLIMTLDLVWASKGYAQDVQYTRCVNGKGEVVIVTNFTCPAGYWRT
jgi:hypothetical protein